METDKKLLDKNKYIACPDCEQHPIAHNIGSDNHPQWKYVGLPCTCGYMNDQMRDTERDFQRALLYMREDRNARRPTKTPKQSGRMHYQG